MKIPSSNLNESSTPCKSRVRVIQGTRSAITQSRNSVAHIKAAISA